jgi:hypothetical protein
VDIFEKYLKSVKESNDQVDEAVLLKFMDFIAKIGQSGISDRKTSKIHIADPMLRFGRNENTEKIW